MKEKITFKHVGADISDIIILPLLLLNSHIVCLSEGVVVVWEKTSSVLCYFGNWKLWGKNISTENQEFLFGKAAQLPVAQAICLSHAPGLMHLLGGEGIKLISKHKKATKQVINASSCILLCCLSQLYKEVECFTKNLWKEPAPASQFQLLLFNVCCTAHQKSQRAWLNTCSLYLSPISGQS